MSRVDEVINATYTGGRPEELDRMTSLARELERENAERLAVIRELYGMGIEFCRSRGWSKHPSIDRAHAIFSRA